MLISDILNEINNTIATNKNPLYSSNLYWSQKAYNICDILIEHLSKENDIILDPFMGSGVSIIEAIKLNRKAIGFEINSLPIFLTETLLENFDIEELKDNIEKFFKKFYLINKDKYITTCNFCGNFANIKKIVFNRENRKSIPDIKEIYYECSCSNKVLVKNPEELDIDKCLNHEVKKEFKLIENSRLAVLADEDLSILFTPRNYSIIINYLKEISKIENEKIKKALIYILISSIHLLKITDLKSNSQWPLWTPKEKCVEKNALVILKKKKEAFFKAILYKNKEFKTDITPAFRYSDLVENNFMIKKEAAQNINKFLPKESVDLIITDPPYMGQVLYSEYLQLYKMIPGMDINLIDEIVISNAKGRIKTEDIYFEMLENSFQAIAKTLKPNKYFCLYFHDSSLEVWSKIISILNKNNLSFIKMCHINKEKNTLKKILDPQKSLNGDALLIFQKKEKINCCFKEKNINDIEEDIRIIVENLILKREIQGITTAQVYDNGVLEYLINYNYLEYLSSKYKSLIPILKKYFLWNQQLGVWQILNTK
ncbi:DNA methyltransferase [Fusobacterium sp.]|uniref:DNA methyltransferase n=1 Tax=Fusobacterium sp. TaxID=68766 RepID=UPI002602752E|nr:DNA methyltransferase [Fusobacterium sp.]